MKETTPHIALVTGASRGLGKYFARALAARRGVRFGDAGAAASTAGWVRVRRADAAARAVAGVRAGGAGAASAAVRARGGRDRCFREAAD